MTDLDVQKKLDDFARNGDEYTLAQWKEFQRELDRHELKKDVTYLEWRAAGDDDAA